ncbi:hypothetical protein EV210_101150 [Anaerospora hongkongensis]|uniref:Uncharacterized protein n=1 Tax=Anaerospora hongkongensis TaxID=244830 RepID=A0A4R1Q4K9_9FIRM|nr:hypothetical protein [Anaerospora hongkongensis]TCL39952.1 hypothetical protein EV210_101150 [Anaerospora hongkongensis]
MIISSNSGTGNHTKALQQYATRVNIINDGATELTVSVNGQIIKVLGLEQFEGNFSPFNLISIIATGPWRYVIEASETFIGDTTATPNGEIIKRIRALISDKDGIEFETSDLVGFLNNAIDWLSLQLIQNGDKEMMKEIIITDGMNIPNDFIKACGLYPIKRNGNTFRILDDSEAFEFQYFANRSHITVNEVDVYLPTYSVFKPIYDGVLIQKTAIIALNRDEYDITQDEALLAQSLQAIGVIGSA